MILINTYFLWHLIYLFMVVLWILCCEYCAVFFFFPFFVGRVLGRRATSGLCTRLTSGSLLRFLWYCLKEPYLVWGIELGSAACKSCSLTSLSFWTCKLFINLILLLKHHSVPRKPLTLNLVFRIVSHISESISHWSLLTGLKHSV